jgi:hypothetical protein
VLRHVPRGGEGGGLMSLGRRHRALELLEQPDPLDALGIVGGLGEAGDCVQHRRKIRHRRFSEHTSYITLNDRIAQQFRIHLIVIRLRDMQALPTFDGEALIAALDEQRAERGLDWVALADELTQQSAQLNAQLADHSMCSGALVRTAKRHTMSCQYALIILRWIRRAPEDFLSGPVVDVGDVRLPEAGPDSRLRWDLSQVHAALNERRRECGLTWAELAEELDCTPNRLTNLRTARLADMHLAMRITQWLGQPAARFVHPARW